jgi:hypothetical protein
MYAWRTLFLHSHMHTRACALYSMLVCGSLTPCLALCARACVCVRVCVLVYVLQLLQAEQQRSEQHFPVSLMLIAIGTQFA